MSARRRSRCEIVGARDHFRGRELCLVGARRWDAGAVDLPGLLRGIIRSVTSAERKKYARAKILVSSEAVEQYPGVADSVEESMIEEEARRELLSAGEGCLDGDADLEDLFLSILAEHVKRDDIAAVLGWNVDRVTAARIKLQRRLVRRAPARFAPHARHRRSS